MITIKFTQLLNTKGAAEKRRIPLLEVKRQTGITWTTLNGWARGELRRADFDTIEKLMAYFGLSKIGDLLEFQPAEVGSDGGENLND